MRRMHAGIIRASSKFDNVFETADVISPKNGANDRAAASNASTPWMQLHQIIRHVTAISLILYQQWLERDRIIYNKRLPWLLEQCLHVCLQRKRTKRNLVVEANVSTHVCVISLDMTKLMNKNKINMSRPRKRGIV